MSDPSSPRYSQWLTTEEIDAIVSPLPAVKSAVRAALKAHNITVLGDHGDFFRVSAPVHVIESSFSTRMYVFQHQRHAQKRLLRALHVGVPSWLSEHVEMIVGLTELPRSTLKPKVRWFVFSFFISLIDGRRFTRAPVASTSSRLVPEARRSSPSLSA